MRTLSALVMSYVLLSAAAYGKLDLSKLETSEDLKNFLSEAQQHYTFLSELEATELAQHILKYPKLKSGLKEIVSSSIPILDAPVVRLLLSGLFQMDPSYAADILRSSVVKLNRYGDSREQSDFLMEINNAFYATTAKKKFGEALGEIRVNVIGAFSGNVSQFKATNLNVLIELSVDHQYDSTGNQLLAIVVNDKAIDRLVNEILPQIEDVGLVASMTEHLLSKDLARANDPYRWDHQIQETILPKIKDTTLGKRVAKAMRISDASLRTKYVRAFTPWPGILGAEPVGNRLNRWITFCRAAIARIGR